MRRFPVPQNKWQWVITILAVIAAIVLQLNQQQHPPKPPGDAPGPASKPRTSQPTRAPEQPRKNTAPGGWQVYENCTLAEHRNNDGDSFDLLCDGRKLTVRLYFVDCPEKRRHQYNGDRIADQARYFGCDEDQAIQTGMDAKDFAEGLLRGGGITFATKHEPVYDSERVYGFVTAAGRDLGEALVGRGLARIHTKGVDGPAPGGEKEEKNRLYHLEREAKSKRLGGWQR